MKQKKNERSLSILLLKRKSKKKKNTIKKKLEGHFNEYIYFVRKKIPNF